MLSIHLLGESDVLDCSQVFEDFQDILFGGLEGEVANYQLG
jgi:hypothetical protein